MTLVTTGIAIDGDILDGTAIDNVSDTPAPTGILDAATDVRRVSSAGTAEQTDRSQPANRPPIHRPPNDIQRFDEVHSHHIPNIKTVRDPHMVNKIRLLTADRIDPVDTVGSG